MKPTKREKNRTENFPELGILVHAQTSVFLVLQVLSNRKDVLARTPEVTRQDAAIGMREQVSEPVHLPLERGVHRHVRRRRSAPAPGGDD